MLMWLMNMGFAGGAGEVAVVPSLGLLEMSDALCQSVEIRDEAADHVEVSDATAGTVETSDG